jgi:hypothetical protein
MPIFSDELVWFAFPFSHQRRRKMPCKARGDMSKVLPVISFFIGAALTAAIVFFGATLDVNLRILELAAWGNGGRPVSAIRHEVSHLITSFRCSLSFKVRP